MVFFFVFSFFCLCLSVIDQEEGWCVEKEERENWQGFSKTKKKSAQSGCLCCDSPCLRISPWLTPHQLHTVLLGKETRQSLGSCPHPPNPDGRKTLLTTVLISRTLLCVCVCACMCGVIKFDVVHTVLWAENSYCGFYAKKKKKTLVWKSVECIRQI